MTDSPRFNGTDRIAEPLTEERIANALDGIGILYGRDPDGDLYAQWDGMRVWFMAAGEDATVLRIMAGWAIRPPVRMLPALLPVINNWNASRRYPVAVVERADEEMVQVLGDLNIDVSAGCTDEFITRQIGLIVGTGLELFAHLAEQFPEHVTWFNAESEVREQPT